MEDEVESLLQGDRHRGVVGRDSPAARPAAHLRVEMTKFDGTPHRGYPAVLLGADDHGRWLGVPRGTVSDAGIRHELPWVLLVPHRAWWTAMFNPPPQGSEIYCDITTPAEWIEDRVIVVDLDLDVKRRRESGAVLLVDADEFDLHSARFGYPEALVRQAWAAAFHLQRALGDGSEPFASHYQSWLDKIMAWSAADRG
jgi:protein associated with RNAse G/E